MEDSGVHIIPTGMEYDRIIMPLFKDFSVKKAYLLIHICLKKRRNIENRLKSLIAL